jgi:hypothetical protein
MNATIICAVCNMPVEKLVWYDNFNTNVRHITAHCHGDMDSMELTAKFVMEAGGGKNFIEGTAFQTKRITT